MWGSLHKKKEERNNAYDFTCIHVQLMQAQVILCWLKLTLPVHLHILSSHNWFTFTHFRGYADWHQQYRISDFTQSCDFEQSPDLASLHSAAHKASTLPPPPSQTTPSLVQVLAWSHNPYPATTLSIFALHYRRASKKTFCLLSGVQDSTVTQWCPVHVHRTCPNHLKHLLFSAILILSHLHNLFSPSMDNTYCQ